MEIQEMAAVQLLIRAADDLDVERDLTILLQRAATLAKDNPALSLLFSVLSEEPPEVAAGWAPALEEMAAKLHPDTGETALARAASMALAQWKDA